MDLVFRIGECFLWYVNIEIGNLNGVGFGGKGWRNIDVFSVLILGFYVFFMMFL